MPIGIYLRTEYHKNKISQAMKGGNKTSFKKGQVAWNKGKIFPNWQNEKRYNWKGNEVSYSGLHYWIQRKLGQPNKCEYCNDENKKRYEWANKSGKYLRELTDWIRLCRSCHIKYDKENNLWGKLKK